MSTPLIIWSTAFSLYAIFWLWYVGFRKPLSKTEIDHYLKELGKFNNNSAQGLTDLRQFLENDTGKSFVMVNSISLFSFHIEDYGKIWENFQIALKNEGCEYWAKLYQNLFENNLKMDRKALRQRVNVPKEIRNQGAASIAFNRIVIFSSLSLLQ